MLCYSKLSTASFAATKLLLSVKPDHTDSYSNPAAGLEFSIYSMLMKSLSRNSPSFLHTVTRHNMHRSHRVR